MKTKIIVFIILLSFFTITGFAQVKTKKELRESRRIEKEKQIEKLVYSKDFIFVGRTALPLGFRAIDLTTNANYVLFQSDSIKSEMPFFGRGYTGIGYGRDAGLKFEGKAEGFTIEKKKKVYEIKTTVKGVGDTYRLMLSVFFEGSATLTITSNNRSTISYNGDVSASPKKKLK
jgi:hypothetical protein